MKPAWQTTEFWATLITNIVGVVALLGYVSSEQASDLTSGLTQIAGAVLMLGSSFGFITGRIALRREIVSAVVYGQPTGDNKVTVQGAVSVMEAIKAAGI